MQIGGSNPGFDVLVIHQHQQKEKNLPVFIQVIYSHERSKTSVSSAEVEDKYEKTMKQIHEQQEWLGSSLDPVFVFLACRKVTRNFKFPEEKKVKIILISKEPLMKLYGPNLSWRPQFFASRFLGDYKSEQTDFETDCPMPAQTTK